MDTATFEVDRANLEDGGPADASESKPAEGTAGDGAATHEPFEEPGLIQQAQDADVTGTATDEPEQEGLPYATDNLEPGDRQDGPEEWEETEQEVSYSKDADAFSPDQQDSPAQERELDGANQHCTSEADIEPSASVGNRGSESREVSEQQAEQPEDGNADQQDSIEHQGSHAEEDAKPETPVKLETEAERKAREEEEARQREEQYAEQLQMLRDNWMFASTIQFFHPHHVSAV
eukprot:scaffold257852_cov45-Prasinocladus_malaysianus.AAC.1